MLTATIVLARSSREIGLLRAGGASRDSAGGMVAGEDEETDGDEVADEGVAVEWSVEEGVSRTWQEDALGVLVADDVYAGELWMTWVMLSATAGVAGGARAALSVYAGDEEA